MKISFPAPAFFFFLILTDCNSDQKPAASPMTDFRKITLTYPETRQDTAVTDDYFGTRIRDPYRWLENDQSDETKEWVRKQNIVTFGYLTQIPYREKIRRRLEQIWNYEKYGTPFREGDRFYFFKNDGLQNQSVLYRQETLDSPPETVIDPNAFSADGTASLGELGFSRDGRYLAYTVSEGGSDWRSVFIQDLHTGRLLPDRIKWAKFTTLAWHADGFYYTRYPEPVAGSALTAANQFGAVYFHRLGTDQARDTLVYDDRKHPDRSFGAMTTEDERFLCISGWESTSGNTLAFRDLSRPESSLVQVVGTFEHDFSVVENLGDKLLVLTNHEAPNQRLILIPSATPEPGRWETLVPENPEDVLQNAQVCGDKIVCSYLHHAASALRIFDLAGNFLKEVTLPEIGTVSGVSGKKGDALAFFGFTSFLRPATIFALDLNTLEPRVFKAPQIDFNPAGYLTEQVWYRSKDGTRVPLFITRKKNIAFDGANPVLLYGYGGFNISLTPAFSPSRAALLENNGIYVVANLRGGGEFGEKWHEAGTKCRKQNVFDDFIAAAEYLIDRKYTSPERLAIQGGSNGGLLVGACMTQRPDLFGVCLPAVGVLDMLRYHKFTIGYAWATDYGRSDNREEFACLIKYSPLHRVREEAYPATLVTTADHDDRVVPAHSFKYAATLQEHQQGDRPVLIRIDTSAGHGAGKPTDKMLDEAADVLSFLLWNMKMQVIY
mgnify:CR=1 FL=1